jgi:hypothetical protein
VALMRPEVRIECIVEGFGEQTAVPVLIEQWLSRKQRREHRRYTWTVDTIVTHDCSRIKNPHNPQRRLGVECYVQTALAKGAHGILVLVDADDDLPTVLGPSLHVRAQAVARKRPVEVVVANHEYEAWFLADLWSLRRRGVFPPKNRLDKLVLPEAKRGCKGIVGELLGRPYEETSDQRSLTAQLSWNRGGRRRSRSFKWLGTVLNRLTREARRHALTDP